MGRLADFLDIPIPDLTPALPILGTVGLILIVLEGSLELELNRSKFAFVGKTFLIAVVPLLLFSFGLAYAFHYFGHTNFKVSLGNAIPYAIISSAMAIPSVQYLRSSNKEFVTYESSLSDIFGVIFFNFIVLNATIDTQLFGKFTMQLLLMIVITIVSVIGLTFLLSKIKHNVKFAPIIIMIIIIYSVSKAYHLPALIFILLFGLFLGNVDELQNNRFIQKLQPEILTREVKKFKELTAESTFLIRTLFFLLFGYLIQLSELFNPETISWAGGIVGGIYLIRLVFLLLFKLPIMPLWFIAPRGLITILLFLTLPLSQQIPLANRSLIIQVIVLTALIMMLGVMLTRNKQSKKQGLEVQKADAVVGG